MSQTIDTQLQIGVWDPTFDDWPLINYMMSHVLLTVDHIDLRLGPQIDSGVG